MLKKTLQILLVCANPRETDPLRTAEEDRTLRESIQLSLNRDKIQVKTLNAATIDDLRRALLNNQFDIVHFSGHGTKRGLIFEDVGGRLMVPSSKALAELLARRGVKTVLLNACYSLSVGKLTSIGLDYTVVSTGPISDPSAIEFTRGFYDAIGAGSTVPDAYEEGMSTVRLKGLAIDSILLARGEEYIPPPFPEAVHPLTKSNSDTSRTLLGIAIDTSGSMQEKIQNRDGVNLTRFNSVKESLSAVGAQIRDDLVRRRINIPDAFRIFIYAFGLRIGSGVMDIASLWRATQDINIKEQIEILKERYEAEARHRALDYSDLAGLARSYGFGGLVDSITQGAKSLIHKQIVDEIADQILQKANRLGDSTLTAEQLAHLFESPLPITDERVVEHILFGLTPMSKAAKEIRERFERASTGRYEQRTLLVISDGEPTDENPREIFAAIRESDITIVACFVTNQDIADPRTLIASPQPFWTSGAKLMWDIASELDETSPFARYFLAQGWSLEPKAKLFVQVNHSDVLKEFMRVAGSNFTTKSIELLPKGQ